MNLNLGQKIESQKEYLQSQIDAKKTEIEKATTKNDVGAMLTLGNEMLGLQIKLNALGKGGGTTGGTPNPAP
jgi:hypothetical protein